eukprot:Awhi_evm2s887
MLSKIFVFVTAVASVSAAPIFKEASPMGPYFAPLKTIQDKSSGHCMVVANGAGGVVSLGSCASPGALRVNMDGNIKLRGTGNHCIEREGNHVVYRKCSENDKNVISLDGTGNANRLLLMHQGHVCFSSNGANKPLIIAPNSKCTGAKPTATTWSFHYSDTSLTPEDILNDVKTELDSFKGQYKKVYAFKKVQAGANDVELDLKKQNFYKDARSASEIVTFCDFACLKNRKCLSYDIVLSKMKCYLSFTKGGAKKEDKTAVYVERKAR